MEVITHSPLPVASQLWQSRPGSWVLTFVAKATFDLQLGKAQLAADQEPIHVQDRYWDDDPGRSVYAPSDLAPMKSRADVLLVGSAYAPKGQSVRSLFARLIVGDLDKSIEVHVDRTFGPDGSLLEGSRFTRMSLGYERAAGGPDTTNPIGVRLDVRDGMGRIKLPNLQPPGLAIHGPGMAIVPVGYGPIAETWPVRTNRLGRYASSWSSLSLAGTPLPDDIDRAFFNAAPPDQQLTEIAEDARIVMENLHPEWPRLVMNLPGLRPHAVLEGRGGQHPLKMRADTLWIDSDRAIACLTFRSHRALERFDEPGRIVISLEEATVTATASTPPPPLPTIPNVPEAPPPKKKTKSTTLIPNSPEERKIKEGLRQSGALPFLPTLPTAAPPRDDRPPMAGGLPFGSAKSAAGHAIQDERTSSGGGLPFVQPIAQRSPAIPTPPPPVRPAPPGWPVAAAGAPPPPLPPGIAPPLPVVAPPLPSPVVPPPVPVAPPSIPKASQPGSSGRSDDNLWGSGISRGDAPAVQSIGQVVVAAATAAAQGAPQDATAGVLGASNAAAGPGQTSSGKREDARVSGTSAIANSGVRAASRLDSRDILHLVWYHADSVARICKVPVWRAILQDMEQEAPDDDLDDPAPNRDPIEIEDMRDIFEILAKAAAEDVVEMTDELASAVRPGNKFVPPLLLLAGELSFPFDERETLKVAVAIASPLATTDEGFKNAVKEAKEFLSSGADQLCPASLAEGYTTRIRETFQRSRRTVPADTLDLQIERALLEGRHYQKRQVLGMNAIRALIHTTTGNSNVKPAPVYIPEEIAKKLPLYQRFRARIIVELYFQEDQYESHLAALKALALGRIQQYPEQRK